MAWTSNTTTITVAGDAIINRRLTDYDNDRLDAVLETVRAADAAAVNLETLLHDYEGYPSATAPGSPMQSPPWVADELAAAGFELFAVANNHTGDYSHGGMLATMRELDARDLSYTGIGEHLADARAPAYLDTPAGRVALVTACSSIPTGSEAGAQGPTLQGRPGLAPLHLETTYTVPEDDLDALRELSDNLGLEDIKARRKRLGFPPFATADDVFRFMHVGADAQPKFEAGDDYAVTQSPNPDDLAALERTIADAARQADWVIASLHAHEGAYGRRNDHSVAGFIEDVAHTCADAGADIFFGHGPHVLRGIELYDDTPLFYSLGNFLFQNEVVEHLPADAYESYDLDPSEGPAALYDTRAYTDDGEGIGFLSEQAFWEGVLPVCHFDGDELERIDLHPLDLGYEESRPGRGFPLEATPDHAADIVDTLADLSEPYGTTISLEDDVGVIQP